MSQPIDGDNPHKDQVAVGHLRDAMGGESSLETCARCQALEARIAELEAAVEARSQNGSDESTSAFPRCHASNSRRFALFRGDGGKVGNYAPHRRVDTGWIKPHTLTSAYPWSLPTSGAGRFCVRRMSR